MGFNAFNGLCYFGNYYDWYTWFDWMESYSNFIKFYALMLILNMAMNIHVTVRFLQLKKEQPELSRSSYFEGK